MKIKKSDYVKLALMIIVPVIFLLYHDVWELLDKRTIVAGRIALYLNIGVLVSVLIWMSIKDRRFKKRVFIAYYSIYWVLLLWLFIDTYHINFKQEWWIYDSFAIITMMPPMFAVQYHFYKLGMRERKNNQEEQPPEPTVEEPERIELTDSMMDTVDDYELLSIVFNELEEKIHRGNPEGPEFLDALSVPQQTVYIISKFESDVTSGGFDEFYNNSGRRYAEMLPEVLKLAGATGMSELVKKTNETTGNGSVSQFDDDFFNLYETENLQQLQANYIRENKISFIVSE
jgi:hypothetical protein